uniref:ATP synthase subunit delta, chloroplastic n=1 Tax=Erythrocystis saccata TaxID=2822695 RepID=A0A8E6L239_9FLOR|nr:ATP synthase CF1 subunit delta [Erythrocystis saccata]
MSNQNFKERVATPYAEALVANAKSLDLLNTYSEELSSILSILSQSKEFQSFLLNPLNSNFTKQQVLRKLFENQIQSFIMNFLLVLVKKRRISYLQTIIEKYLEITYSLESIVIAELYSAVDLDENQKTNLINKIKSLTGSNQIRLLTNKDSSLIAGFILKIGSKVIDASLAGKLKKISSYLNSN